MTPFRCGKGCTRDIVLGRLEEHEEECDGRAPTPELEPEPIIEEKMEEMKVEVKLTPEIEDDNQAMPWDEAD